MWRCTFVHSFVCFRVIFFFLNFGRDSLAVLLPIDLVFMFMSVQAITLRVLLSFLFALFLLAQIK